MYGKRFAAQEHAFELLCSPHDHTIGVIRQLCLADASAVQAVTPSDIYSWHPLAPNETLSVVAMCISNKDRSPVRTHG